jgi:hypothetical protein
MRTVILAFIALLLLAGPVRADVTTYGIDSTGQQITYSVFPCCLPSPMLVGSFSDDPTRDTFSAPFDITANSPLITNFNGGSSSRTPAPPRKPSCRPRRSSR